MWDHRIGENGKESKFGPDLVVRDRPPSIDVLDDLNRNWRLVKIVSACFSLRLETKIRMALVTVQVSGQTN